MKCPNCGYDPHTTPQYNDDGSYKYPGEQHEKFYFLSIEMKSVSASSWRGEPTRGVVGCPKCRIVFIED